MDLQLNEQPSKLYSHKSAVKIKCRCFSMKIYPIGHGIWNSKRESWHRLFSIDQKIITTSNSDSNISRRCLILSLYKWVSSTLDNRDLYSAPAFQCGSAATTKGSSKSRMIETLPKHVDDLPRKVQVTLFSFEKKNHWIDQQNKNFSRHFKDCVLSPAELSVSFNPEAKHCTKSVQQGGLVILGGWGRHVWVCVR